MPETTALGAAMAAGAAEGVSVWSLSPEDLSEVTSEKFEPQINPEESELRYARWKKAVQRSMNWETMEPVGSENGETSIFSSVPLGFYIMGSMLMLIGAKFLAGQCPPQPQLGSDLWWGEKLKNALGASPPLPTTIPEEGRSC